MEERLILYFAFFEKRVFWAETLNKEKTMKTNVKLVLLVISILSLCSVAGVP